jgi:hypothetical protein
VAAQAPCGPHSAHLRDLSRRLTMADCSDSVLTHQPQRR